LTAVGHISIKDAPHRYESVNVSDDDAYIPMMNRNSWPQSLQMDTIPSDIHQVFLSDQCRI